MDLEVTEVSSMIPPIRLAGLRTHVTNALRRWANLVCRYWLGLRSDAGAQTVEYVALSGVAVVLIGAVVLFLGSGGGQIVIDALRDVINAIIAGFARGW